MQSGFFLHWEQSQRCPIFNAFQQRSSNGKSYVFEVFLALEAQGELARELGLAVLFVPLLARCAGVLDLGALAILVRFRSAAEELLAPVGIGRRGEGELVATSFVTVLLLPVFGLAYCLPTKESPLR